MNKEHKIYTITDYVKVPYEVSKIYTCLIILLKISISLMPATLLLSTGFFLDQVLIIFKSSSNNENLFFSFLVLLVVISLNWLLDILYDFFRLKLELKLSKQLNLLFIHHIASLKYFYIEDNTTLELIERVNDSPETRWLGGFENLLNLAQYIIQVAALFIIIASNHILVSCIILVLFVPFFLISLQNGKEEYEAYEESSTYFRRAKYFSNLLTSRDNLDERSLFSFQNYINEKWGHNYTTAINIEKQANKQMFTRVGICNSIAIFFVCLITLILTIPVSAGTLSVGIYIALIKAIHDFIETISWQFVDVINKFTINNLYLKDISNFFKLEIVEEVLEPTIDSEKNLLIDTIEFKDVTFIYPNTTKKILDNFSLSLDSCKTYSIVGENGCGKTTLIKLLSGLYEDYTGQILINGIDIRKIEKKCLRTYMSIVYQDFCKYQISLKDNLLLSNSSQNITNHNLESILVKLKLDSLMNRLPNGLNTPLGKLDTDSIDLSGGEWQKIAIARGLLNNAPLHILDEPTAALDPISELNLYRTFQEVISNKFTVFITHRLGAAKLADEIIVIRKGSVIEQGSHNDLMMLDGYYAKMFNTQRSWYDEK